MKYLLDTDHISVLQLQAGPAYTTLRTRMAQHPRTDLAVSIISLHEQVLGCHTYLQRARTTREVVHGYTLLAQVLEHFTIAPVLPFDEPAAMVKKRRLYSGCVLRKVVSAPLARLGVLPLHFSPAHCRASAERDS